MLSRVLICIAAVVRPVDLCLIPALAVQQNMADSSVLERIQGTATLLIHS